MRATTGSSCQGGIGKMLTTGTGLTRSGWPIVWTSQYGSTTASPCRTVADSPLDSVIVKSPSSATCISTSRFAPGATTEARVGASQDSNAHGDVNSPRKNTALESRTRRSTSASNSFGFGASVKSGGVLVMAETGGRHERYDTHQSKGDVHAEVRDRKGN